MTKIKSNKNVSSQFGMQNSTILSNKQPEIQYLKPDHLSAAKKRFSTELKYEETAFD